MISDFNGVEKEKLMHWVEEGEVFLFQYCRLVCRAGMAEDGPTACRLLLPSH